MERVRAHLLCGSEGPWEACARVKAWAGVRGGSFAQGPRVRGRTPRVRACRVPSESRNKGNGVASCNALPRAWEALQGGARCSAAADAARHCLRTHARAVLLVRAAPRDAVSLTVRTQPFDSTDRGPSMD